MCLRCFPPRLSCVTRLSHQEFITVDELVVAIRQDPPIRLAASLPSRSHLESRRSQVLAVIYDYRLARPGPMEPTAEPRACCVDPNDRNGHLVPSTLCETASVATEACDGSHAGIAVPPRKLMTI